MDLSYKHCHQNVLIKLSRVSGLYPECIVLKDISFGPNPVACGGFAEITFRLRGQEIAVKRLRTYEKVDIDKLFKVTSLRNI